MSKKQLLALSGVAAVLLIVAAFAVGGESPETDDPVGEVVSYYEDNDSELMIASGLLAIGSFFFLLFSVTLTEQLRRARPDRWVAPTLSLGGGILFAVGATIFSGLEFGAAEAVEDIDPAAIQAIHALSSGMFFTLAVGVAAFALGAGVATLNGAPLPRWLAWIAIAIGVVALTPAGFLGFLALGIWTLVASIMLAMRADDPDRGSTGAEPPN